MHSDFVEKPFECGVCSATFFSKQQLGAHNLKHGNLFALIGSAMKGKFAGIVDPYFEKFRCDICKKVLPHRTALEQHKQGHLGEFFVKLCYF